MEYVQLNNNIKMPVLGCACQVDSWECEQCVLNAISEGYRLIDTGQTCQSEEAVGNAAEKCGVPRDELFITTKVWNSDAGYEKAKDAIEKSLKKLRTDYIDLLLVHQPFGNYYGAYRAMEEAYKEGWIRAIGVSNFYPDRLADLCSFAEVRPAVNQLETHAFWQQKAAGEYMSRYDVQHEAWVSFAEGREGFPADPALLEISEKHRKSASQTALRYLIQKGMAVIPKSVYKEHMKENFDVFDFVLDAEDMARIETLDGREKIRNRQ